MTPTGGWRRPSSSGTLRRTVVWAGLIESFLSQNHEPAVPYWAKIAFGSAQLAAVVWWLARSGGDGEAGQGKDGALKSEGSA